VSTDDDRLRAEAQLESTEQRFASFLLRFGVDVAGPDSAINQIRLATMVAFRCMLDGAQEKATPAVYAEGLRRARHTLLQELWLNNLFETPWLFLVEKEFPGDPLGPADLQRLAQKSLGDIRDEEERHREFMTMHREVIELLESSGYVLEEDDSVVVAAIVSSIRVMQTYQQTQLASSKTVEKLREQVVGMLEHATDPDHLAWQAVLERYVPKPDQ
jgi:hypothetical protein